MRLRFMRLFTNIFFSFRKPEVRHPLNIDDTKTTERNPNHEKISLEQDLKTINELETSLTSYLKKIEDDREKMPPLKNTQSDLSDTSNPVHSKKLTNFGDEGKEIDIVQG